MMTSGNADRAFEQQDSSQRGEVLWGRGSKGTLDLAIRFLWAEFSIWQSGEREDILSGTIFQEAIFKTKSTWIAIFFISGYHCLLIPFSKREPNRFLSVKAASFNHCHVEIRLRRWGPSVLRVPAWKLRNLVLSEILNLTKNPNSCLSFSEAARRITQPCPLASLQILSGHQQVYRLESRQDGCASCPRVRGPLPPPKHGYNIN